MTVNCFQLNHDLKVTPSDFKNAIEAIRDPNAKVWFDVLGAETSELEMLLGQLDIKDLTRRLCIEARGRSGFYPLNSSIFLVIPVQADPEHLNNVEYISVLCQKNFLLTLRTARESRIQQIATVKELVDWLHDDTIPGLVSTILMIFSLENLQQLSELREHIVELEERLERVPERVNLKEISEKRSRILTLEAVVSGQLPELQALIATDKPFFELKNSHEHLMSALANLQSADRSLRWLGGRLDVIRSDFEMRSQDKLNRRLTRLTILSTIFMPITFMAGVWGMNFEYMPALGQPYGYAMALAFMAVISVSMYFYFKRKGWFE